MKSQKKTSCALKIVLFDFKPNQEYRFVSPQVSSVTTYLLRAVSKHNFLISYNNFKTAHVICCKTTLPHYYNVEYQYINCYIQSFPRGQLSLK